MSIIAESQMFCQSLAKSKLIPKMKDDFFIDLATDDQGIFEVPEGFSFLSSEVKKSISSSVLSVSSASVSHSNALLT